MSESPETRMSLLLRLKSGEDGQAWVEFCEVYEPILRRISRSMGVSDQDVSDAVQEILMRVHRSIGQFEHREHRCSFRGWLAKVSRNTAHNFLTRRSMPRAVGGSSVWNRLQQQADRSSEFDRLWDRHYQQQLLERAALRIAHRVQSKTFAAFWKTVVEGISPSEIAIELGMTVGAIYVHRGRVMAMLQQEVAWLQSEESQKLGEVSDLESSDGGSSL